MTELTGELTVRDILYHVIHYNGRAVLKLIDLVFQVSSSPSEESGMLLLLSLGGMGVFLLVIGLAFLAATLASKNHGQDDMDGILEAEEDDFNSIENERAVFIIGEMDKFETKDLSESIHEKEGSDNIVPYSINRHAMLEKIVKTVKLKGFNNGLM